MKMPNKFDPKQIPSHIRWNKNDAAFSVWREKRNKYALKTSQDENGRFCGRFMFLFRWNETQIEHHDEALS